MLNYHIVFLKQSNDFFKTASVSLLYISINIKLSVYYIPGTIQLLEAVTDTI